MPVDLIDGRFPPRAKGERRALKMACNYALLRLADESHLHTNRRQTGVN
jgi:hypothetical protein